ncbi:glycerophosphodiester phosphodiesterase [Gemmatimonas sp.]
MSAIRPHRPGTRPAIIAHRGASRDFRENTLPAFRRALELEADGIELDVHGTRDGVLVVHHDATLAIRHGESIEDVPIASLTAADVAAHRLLTGDLVPTLDAVCALVGERAVLYVEVKAPHVEAMVAAFLDRHPAVRTEVHAFDHRIPVGVRAVRPGTPIGLLSASYPLDVRGVLSWSDATAWWQHADLIDEPLVLAVHEAGVRLIAWTVNSAPHARQLAAWGVDGICTDVPDLIRSALTVLPGAPIQGA